MPTKNINTFFFSVVIPSLLAIGFFIISIFAVIIPSFEKNVMDRKKEMISELTNTAWSLLEEFHEEYKNGSFSLEEAQRMAASRVSRMRYGAESKDYFWIIDTHPNMIMHPYRPELTKTDLTEYQDPNGKKLFVEAARLVQSEGEGYINYMWQWKDDETRIVPKLSYVKEFPNWGWIVGTGVYLEDVAEEIRLLKKRLLNISLIITLIIITILSYVIRQSFKIENKRKAAESDLKFSRQKYKSLVEASTEGTLMFLNQTIIYCNEKFSTLIGYNADKVMTLKFEDIFNMKWQTVKDAITDPKKSKSFETKLKCQNKQEKLIIISVSQIKYDYDIGYIIVAKEVSQKKLLERETESLAEELKSSLLLMNQPIKHFVRSMPRCTIDSSIGDAVNLMIRKKQDVMFIHSGDEAIGVINNSDLKKRVLAKKLDTTSPVASIMSSPIISLNDDALLYEAVLLLKNEQVSHLAVKNLHGFFDGVISFNDIANMQQNSVSYLLKEIEISEDIDGLKKIHTRVPVLVNALVNSGDKTPNITRIITSVSDAIATRVIELALEEWPEPPCDFAFMVMGSEGRMEQTLATDQDNAIVFSDNSDSEMAHSYFQKLATLINTDLNTIGYQFCKGEVMAMNPKWNQSLHQWKKYFTHWINNSEPQSILDASIFFDFRCLYGNQTMVTELRSHVVDTVENKPVFFYNLAQSVMKFKPPTSVLSNKATFDIKKVILPVTAFIRLYALQNKSVETNTLIRLQELHAAEIIQKTMYDELLISYNYLMQLRFRFQASNILDGAQPTNEVDASKLTEIELTTLKKVFGEINNLQTKLNFDFKGVM